MKKILKRICSFAVTLVLVVAGCLAMPSLDAFAAPREITVTPDNFMNFVYNTASGATASGAKPFELGDHCLTVSYKDDFNITIEGDFSGYTFNIDNYIVSPKTVNFKISENAKVGIIANTRGEVENHGRIENRVSSNSLVNYGYINELGAISNAIAIGPHKNINNGTVRLWKSDAGQNASGGVILEVAGGKMLMLMMALLVLIMEA